MQVFSYQPIRWQLGLLLKNAKKVGPMLSLTVVPQCPINIFPVDLTAKFMLVAQNSLHV